MRTSHRSALALAAVFLVAPLAVAQPPDVKITGVRVGFPGSLSRTGFRGASNTRFRVGSWAPVYVDLEVRDAALQRGSYFLVVETTDSDDMQNVYVEKRFLPTVEPKESPTLLTYARVGSSNSEVTVRVVEARADGGEGRDLCKRKHLTQSDIQVQPSSVYGYLTLGGKTSSLYKALVDKGKPGAAAGQPAPLDNPLEPPDPEENNYRFFAHMDQVQQMPTLWFGYEGADMVVLLTGKQQFATELSSRAQDDPFAVRREALAEWVRRGGRLIVSVSKNSQEVNQILEQMKIIDLSIQGARIPEPSLRGVAQWVRVRDFPDPGRAGGMEIAPLKLGPSVQVLAYTKSVEGTLPGDRPVIVQAACGLGRVIVVGFDLDEAPFTAWSGREPFWERMKEITEPTSIPKGQLNDFFNRRWMGANNDGSEFSAQLVSSLEAFPDVPVISFGWVALFILVYIIIVGPLDYFFLKKVVKRLELTWITFPAVVIVISAVAYFAAYYLKGKDLRVNKVDVVDVDLRGGNVYANTWFTLFSPRIQNYTIGVEPGTGWGSEERDPKKFSPYVSWMGKPEDAYGMGRGGGGGGLFRRAYNYAPDYSKTYAEQLPSAGLVGVPIQVWSTKTFSASWYRPVKENELVEAEVTVAKNDPSGMKLSGTVTSHLPVELHEVALFYRDKYYPLDNLVPGTPQRIDDKMGQGNTPTSWLGQPFSQNRINAAPVRRPGPGFNQQAAMPSGFYIKSILFHDYAAKELNPGQGGRDRNSLLRFLDEKWRLDARYVSEAVLCGRAVLPSGQSGEGGAEDISQSGLSGSKLWLGSLPGGSAPRSRIDGTMSQETYVRIYIPVK
jgi:hypothetical protein